MTKRRKVLLMGATALTVLALAGLNPSPLSIAHAAGEPFGLTARTPLEGVNFPLAPPSGGGNGVEVFHPFHANLSFDRPLYVTAAPGNDNDLFVLQQGGTIKRFVNAPGTQTSSTFLNITDRVLQNGHNEQGLLGLVFHPQYASNGYFYVYYIPTGGVRRARLSRFRRSSSNPDVGDPSSENILLTFNQPEGFGNHNGGCLQFGPDGKIYLAVGDGGSANDPPNNAQNIEVVMGKMLRLNDDGSIPSDNPFVNKAGRDEIWAVGLRNPWRFSFDPANGKLWLGDVGQNALEEVDVIKKGGNYGWRIFEANRSNINPNHLPASDFDGPVFKYPRKTDTPGGVFGRSITGGYVYRGSAVPALVGKYMFADFLAGKVWTLTQNDGVVGSNPSKFVGNVPLPASFGRDNQGNIYVASFDGSLYSFRATGGGGSTTPEAPQKLSQTGLFTDTASLTPNPGLIEYGINAPFWSDGTLKRRWVGLDGTTKITFNATGAWAWPQKAVLVKHFEIDLADGSRKRLETRVLFNGSTGWRGYSYRWNDAETDATLLPDSPTSIEFDALDPDSPGGSRHQTYIIPSRSECLECHTPVGGNILGAGKTVQMNRDFVYPNGVTDNQLRSLNHINLFTQDIGAASQYGALTNPEDTSAPLASRARAYLDTNCSQCHQPGGPTPVSLDLRASRTDAQTNTIGVRPVEGSLGLTDAFVIAPGSKERSVLWERMRRLDDSRMPRLGSHTVDRAGVDVVGQWIDSLSPTQPGLPSIAFSSSAQTVSESASTVTVKVTLSAASTSAVQASLVFGGNAKSPADYAAPPTTVTIPAGSTSVNLSLSLVDDALDEAGETLTLTLASPSNADLGTKTQHTVTITDNDPTPTVSFATASASIGEAGGGLTVQINLSAVSGRTVSVPISFSGSTATDPADYTSSTKKVTISAGASSGSLRLTVKNDQKNESDEKIFVNMGTPTAANKGAVIKQTVTIVDND